MTVVKNTFRVLLLPAVLIAVWFFATQDSANAFVPKPAALGRDFTEVWMDGLIQTEVLPSLGRLSVGLLAAIVLGILCGGLIGLNPVVRKLLTPLLEFIRAIPAPVLLPVLMMLMGIESGSKVFLIALGCVWPILLNTVDGVRSIDGVLADTTRTYGVSGWHRFRFLILPAAMPRIMTGIRLALPIGIILMVVSEMYAVTSGGLGSQIMYFQRTFQNGPMWVGIFLLGVLGVLLFFLYSMIDRRVLAWYYGQRELEQND